MPNSADAALATRDFVHTSEGLHNQLTARRWYCTAKLPSISLQLRCLDVLHVAYLQVHVL